MKAGKVRLTLVGHKVLIEASGKEGDSVLMDARCWILDPGCSMLVSGSDDSLWPGVSTDRGH